MRAQKRRAPFPAITTLRTRRCFLEHGRRANCNLQLIPSNRLGCIDCRIKVAEVLLHATRDWGHSGLVSTLVSIGLRHVLETRASTGQLQLKAVDQKNVALRHHIG